MFDDFESCDVSRWKGDEFTLRLEEHALHVASDKNERILIPEIHNETLMFYYFYSPDFLPINSRNKVLKAESLISTVIVSN